MILLNEIYWQYEARKEIVLPVAINGIANAVEDVDTSGSENARSKARAELPYRNW